MNARGILAVSSLLALAGLVACTESSERWLLRLDLDEGDEYRFAMTQSQSTSFGVPGMGSQQVENRSRIEFRQTVSARRADGSMVLDTTYERMTSKLDAGAQKIEYDTSEPGDDPHPLAKAQGFLMGKHFSVSVSPRGEVLEVDGFDAIFAELGEAFEGDAEFGTYLDVVRQGFGGEAVKAMMQQGVVMYPEARVGVGDGWKRAVDLPNPALGNMQIDSEYVVDGAESKHGRDCVKLAVASTIVFEGGGQLFGQFEQMGADVQLDVSEAEGSGTIWIDQDSGMIVSSRMDQKIVMDMKVVVPDNEAVPDMNMHAVVDQTVEIELLEP